MLTFFLERIQVYTGSYAPGCYLGYVERMQKRITSSASLRGMLLQARCKALLYLHIRIIVLLLPTSVLRRPLKPSKRTYSMSAENPDPDRFTLRWK